MTVPFDDSALAPAGYETLCALPVQTGGGSAYTFPPASYSFPGASHSFSGPGYVFPEVGVPYFSVKDFGAVGNGIADDTVALRTVFAKAFLPNKTILAYLPTGTYNVCPQAGDPTNSYGGKLIFDLSAIPSTSQLVIIGDGPTLTFIKGFMPSLANPTTTWDTVGGQVSRFIMFQSITSGTPAGSFQLRSLTVDGQAGWTGNYTVGGNVTTGAGWDLYHKCVRIDGTAAVDDVLIYNANLKNFRGEIVYAGGTASASISNIISTVDNTNASAVSCSTDYLDVESAIGPSVYNAVENFAIDATDGLEAHDSTFSGKTNGIAYLGVSTASCLVDGCTLSNSTHAMLLSESGTNITVQDCTFSNNTQGVINAILGTYPQYPIGFTNVTLTNNAFTSSGTPVVLQSPIDNLTGSGNTNGGLSYSFIPEVVERWLMNESTGSRAGSMSTGPAINPGQISLDDPSGMTSDILPDATVAAHVSSGKTLTTSSSNSAGRTNYQIFDQGYGSWTLFFRMYFASLPSGSKTLMGRDANNSWDLYIQTFPKTLVFETRNARTSAYTTLASTKVISATTKYSVAIGYNGATGKVFIVVIDPAGAVTRTESTVVGRRYPYQAVNLSLGDFRVQGTDYDIQDSWFLRAAYTDTQLQQLHNGGTPVTLSTSRVLLSPRASGWWPRPFSILSTTADFETASGIASRGGCSKGMYFYRPFPLFQWDAGLAATKGNFAWVHSSDHTNVGASAGVWIGFSSAPGTRPSSWTKIIAGTGTASGRVFTQLETPHLVYNASDSNARPFYCYAHGFITSGGPSGTVPSPQETFLWTSADLVSWTSEGVAIPAGAQTGSVPFHNHTGYATIHPPNSLPGQTNWRAYALGWDTTGIEYCYPSSDGKTFLLADDVEPLDYCTPFPAGYDLVQFRQNIFTFDGVTVYGIGQAFMPGSRGTALTKLVFENGAWRQSTGEVWRITNDTDIFPTNGYTQDIRAWADMSTNIVHLYQLTGFFLNSGDERINYIRLQF